MWQLLVFLRVLFAHIINPILLKSITGLPSRTSRLAWQFGFTFLLSAALTAIARSPLNNAALLIIVLIGMVNSFGAYSQWRAIDISLSKTSLFTQADDFIAIALGFLILKEGQTITPLLGFGIALCIISAISFSIVRPANNEQKKRANTNWKRLGIWIASYSVIWGVAIFLMRYFAKSEVPLPSFLVAWYGGSFLGSLLIRAFAGKKEQGSKLPLRAIGTLGILASIVWISLLLNYAVLQRIPIAVAQPIFQATEMVFPTVIGLWIFKEGKSLRLAEKMLFAGAIIGVTIISLTFSH